MWITIWITCGIAGDNIRITTANQGAVSYPMGTTTHWEGTRKCAAWPCCCLAAVAFTSAGVSAAVADEPPARTAKKTKAVLKAKPITKAPPPSAATSSGFYVGVNGGYNWGRATLSGFPFLENSIDARNGMAGITFGYNAQSGSVVYGFETDLDAAWMNATNWGLPPCFACEVQLRYFGTVARPCRLRGRQGAALLHRRPGLWRTEDVKPSARHQREGRQVRLDGRRRRRIRDRRGMVDEVRIPVLRTREDGLRTSHLRRSTPRSRSRATCSAPASTTASEFRERSKCERPGVTPAVSFSIRRGAIRTPRRAASSPCCGRTRWRRASANRPGSGSAASRLP